MALTDTVCRRAAKKDRPYKIADGDGMYLLVQPNGSRLWRFNYRFDGKHKTLAMGAYPEVSLADARERRTEARKLLAAATDPLDAKRVARQQAELEATSTFEIIAREWHANEKAAWKESHAARVMSKLERDIFPVFGDKPITQIEPPEILAAMRSIEARGAIDVTKRTRQYVGAIFRFAIATGRATRDSAADIRGALKKAPKVRHRAKLEEADLPEFLRLLEEYNGDEQTQLAIRFTLLSLVRTNEIRFGEWSEFSDFDVPDPLWRIPGPRMKKLRDHLVPLAPQAVAVLRRLKHLSNGSRWVLPANSKKGVISENTMLYALYRMGYHSRLTIHGFRGTASTILNEHGFNRDWVELQLSHVEDNQVRAAYNAAQWLPGRREMLVWWADYLDKSVRAKKKAVPTPG